MKRDHIIDRTGWEFSGAVAWSADGIFRPTVGLYVDGQLALVATTSRELGSGGVWSCRFGFSKDRVSSLKPGTVSITCLETGDYIEPKKTGTDGSVATVEDLLRQAQGRRRAWPSDGFATFLRLPIVDQLYLLYNDILRRAPDHEAFDLFSEALLAGDLTILDIRDRLICSEEFLGQRRSRDERAGHWIVWSSLRNVSDNLATTRSGHLTAPATGLDHDQIAGGKVLQPLADIVLGARNYVARIALGQHAPPEAIRAWVETEAVKTMAGWPTPRATSITVRGNRSRADVLLRGLLTSMTVGPAGRLAKGRISSVETRRGIVCYGPYLQPRAGRYRLKLKLVPAASSGAPSDDGSILIEARYRDLVLGSADVPLSRIENGIVDLLWDIPPSKIGYFSKPLLEFRVSTDGLRSWTIESLDITISELDQAKAAATFTDWGPHLRIGSAGVPEIGNVVVAKSNVPGHLFYGPYAAMLPGEFRLEVSARVKPPKFRSDSIIIEVLASEHEIASARVTLSEGLNVFKLPFAIAASGSDALVRDVQFRMHISGRSRIAVTQVRCHFNA